MKHRKISKAEEKRRAAFDAKVILFLTRLGAEKVDREPFQSYRIRNTVCGPLLVTPFGNWIACRFDDVELAKKVLPHGLQYDRLNPYSGKWNFTDSCDAQFAGESSFSSFKYELRKLLTTEMPTTIRPFTGEQTPAQSSIWADCVQQAEADKAWALKTKYEVEWRKNASTMSIEMLCDRLGKSAYELAIDSYRYRLHQSNPARLQSSICV